MTNRYPRPHLKLVPKRPAPKLQTPNKYALYFAYGSNLNLAQMARRCPDARPIGPATMPNWKLSWNCYANVSHSPGEECPGGLWLVTRRDLRALDRYEGYPTLYDRFLAPVVDGEGRHRMAITYAMPDTLEYRGEPSIPYVTSILEGYEDFGIQDTHGLIDLLQELKAEAFMPLYDEDEEDEEASSQEAYA